MHRPRRVQITAVNPGAATAWRPVRVDGHASPRFCVRVRLRVEQLPRQSNNLSSSGRTCCSGCCRPSAKKSSDILPTSSSHAHSSMFDPKTSASPCLRMHAALDRPIDGSSAIIIIPVSHKTKPGGRDSTVRSVAPLMWAGIRGRPTGRWRREFGSLHLADGRRVVALLYVSNDDLIRLTGCHLAVLPCAPWRSAA